VKGRGRSVYSGLKNGLSVDPHEAQREACVGVEKILPWLRSQSEAFEAAFSRAPLQEPLGALALMLTEAMGDDTRAAFYLYDNGSLRHVVGMDDAYAAAVDGVDVGPEFLACGSAPHGGRPILIEDVTTDESWRPWRRLAERFGYRACWSFPICTKTGTPIGVLAVYSRQPRKATEREIELASILSRTAAVVISRHVETTARDEALRRSEELTRQILQALPAQIIVLDRRGRISFTNYAWERSVAENGASGAGVGADYLDVCRGSVGHDARFARMAFDGIQSVLQGRQAQFVMDYPCDSPGERRWFQMTVSPLGASGEGGAVVAHMNISERKLAEEALQDADRRKNEFLATLAHELRNPLSPIHSAVHIWKRTGAHDAPLLDMVERQVKHLLRLVDDLLEVSRITRGKIELRKENVAVNVVVRQALESCRPLIERKMHRLSLKSADEPLRVFGDPVRLVQIMSNLVNNAAKYTPANGVIEIESAREGDEAVLRVRDNGRGVAPDMLPRLFELFMQIDSVAAHSEGGLGIGLALVRSLVEMHGGRVEAHSEGLGRGCEFVVRLPLTDAPATGTTGEAASSVAKPTAGGRILVVDDSRDVADSFESLLETMGAEVRVAYDGRTALEILPAFKPEAVLMDLGMPEMDGYETARRLRRLPEGRDVMLIALTGWGQDEDRRRTKDAGFDRHLVKPADPEVLESLLAELRARAPKEGAQANRDSGGAS
jgi:signal transduction histidine kinase/ActR/RegA family two-component response regulator